MATQSSLSGPDYFTSDPEWEAYAGKIGYPLPTGTGATSIEIIQPLEMDIAKAQADQILNDASWLAAHPPESIGYTSQLIAFKVRDETEISLKISHPDYQHSRYLERGVTGPLPVLFVTYGGGWVQGSHLSEEAWLLWPLYEHFELVVVSVEYRLAPDHQFPVWIDDSYDVLKSLLSHQPSIFSNLNVKLDLGKVILAGSSSGAGISAALSQICREERLPIFGVILNVPVLCDYRHFPTEFDCRSYQQCVETFSSGAMVMVWNLTHPSPFTGCDVKASPLLGNCADLSQHMIFVAGQDALRDEGISYAAKLRKYGVSVGLKVYSGVPHDFAQFSDLRLATEFHKDLRTALKRWLNAP